jgi:hypothetical protein
VLVDTFKQFDELIGKIDETRNAISEFSGASGETLDALTSEVTALASTFGIDAQEINEAAQKLSEDLGISFSQAVGEIEKGLLSGATSTQEFFEIIDETPERIGELTAAAGEYTERQKEVLDANKELAEAQLELTNEFAGSASEIKAFVNRGLARLIKFALSLVETFKPVVSTIFEIGQGLGELIGSIFGAGDAAKGVQNIFKGLASILKFSADTSLFFINTLRAGVDFLRGDASTAFKLFTREGKILAEAEERLAETTKDLTKEFQSETEELNSLFGQLANTNQNTEERRELIEKLNEQYGDYLPNIDLEKAGQEDLALAYDATTKAIAQNLIDRKKIEVQTKAQSQVLEDNIELARVFEKEREAFKERERLDEELERLKSIEATSRKLGKTIAERVKANKEFNAARSERIKLQKESSFNRKAATKEIELINKASDDLVETLSSFITLSDAQTKATEDAAAAALRAEKDKVKEQEKLRDEQAKKAIERQKKLNEELRKERERFALEEAAFIQKQSQLLTKLRERQEALIIEGLSDIQQKARLKAKEGQAKRIEQAEKDFNTLKGILQKREDEALKLFGEGSPQFKEAQEANKKGAIEAQKELSAIIARERLSLTNELLKIDENFNNKRNEQQVKQLEARQARESEALERAALSLDAALSNGLINEQEFFQKSFELQREKLKKELAQIEEQEKLLAKLGVKISEEQTSQILTEKQKLYTELSKLDKGFAEEQKKNAEDVTKTTSEENAKRLADFQQSFSQVVEGFKIGLSFLDDLQSASDERRLKSIEKQEEANQIANEQLQERLSQASGLEAQFLRQQIEANVNAAETIARDREKIEKERAKRAKARAIIESIIQTALAVVQALPDPVTSVLAGVAGAAATATIAAQPLAKGGKVGELSGEVIQFNKGGRVTSKGNIKPLSNGDNVLATLKTGEVVLNEEQQNSIGGPAVLAAAGVPNFALGGRVGSPLTLTTKSNKLAQDNSEILARLEDNIISNSERIDNIKVIWTSDSQSEQDKGLEERAQIQVNAQF